MTSNPKQLKIDEMWKLYRLLKDSIPHPLSEKPMENITHVFTKANPKYIQRAIHIMYGDEVHWTNMNDAIVLFANGISQSGFFEFSNYVGKI
jgi:hypothetical protein